MIFYHGADGMRVFHRSMAEHTKVAFFFLNKPQQQRSLQARALLKQPELFHPTWGYS